MAPGALVPFFLLLGDEKKVDAILQIARLCAVMLAAVLLGKWFLSEVGRARAMGKPMITAYLSIPGILILLGVLSPIVIWMFRH